MWPFSSPKPDKAIFAVLVQQIDTLDRDIDEVKRDVLAAPVDGSNVKQRKKFLQQRLGEMRTKLRKMRKSERILDVTITAFSGRPGAPGELLQEGFQAMARIGFAAGIIEECITAAEGNYSLLTETWLATQLLDTKAQLHSAREVLVTLRGVAERSERVQQAA